MVTVSDRIRDLLDGVKRALPGGSLFRWCGRRVLPDGTDPSRVSTQLDWEANYALLELAALPPSPLTPLPNLKALVRDTPQDGPIPIAVAHMTVWQLDEQVIAAYGDPAPENGTTPVDANACSWVDKIEKRTVFMAAPLMPDQWDTPVPQVRARIFQIVIDARMYLTTPDRALPQRIEIDTGNGPRQVQFGQRITCVCDDEHGVTIKLRVESDGETNVATFRIPVSATPAARVPDELWPLRALNGRSGRAVVYKCNVANQLNPQPRKFVVIGEGFPGGYAPSYLYDAFNQHGLLAGFAARGYDTVFITFDNGLDKIEANAEVFIAGIQAATDAAAKSHDGKQPHEPHIAGGFSMGGLVARYALTLMEHRQQAHHCAAYLSLDVPHNGSRTSVAAQWFAHYFKDAVPYMRSLVALLSSPANQEFLPLLFYDNQVSESPVRRRFYTLLNRIGDHPRAPVSWAISSGRGDGVAGSKQEELLTWSGSPFACAQLHTLPPGTKPEMVASGQWVIPGDVCSTLKLSDGITWDDVQGSLATYVETLAFATRTLECGDVSLPRSTTCVVPTTSALSFELNVAPNNPIPSPPSTLTWFDDYVWSAENLRHIQISAEVCDWILDHVGALDCRVRS